MEEIDLSVMSYTPEAIGQLQNVIAEFEANNHVRVNIHTLSWESSWSEILKYVFHGHGPAVSEVGDTWVSSLSKMNALRAFTRAEVEAIGGEDAFLAATWQRELSTKGSAWSIPWLAETRVIIYRRDLLEAAGVDEQTAFETHDRMVETLEQLRESGIINPWIVPTTKTLNTLHNLPSWIWGTGGDFVDADYRSVTIADPAARAGIRNYYSLYRFIDPAFYGFDASQAEGTFLSGKAAVTINGPWMVFPTYEIGQPDVLDKIGVALMPGQPCVLASNLVIWKHTPVREERLAVALVKFLTESKVQRICGQQTGLLPARLETLAREPYETHPFYKVFVKGLKFGRSLPTIRLWGLIEERLTMAFGNLWEKILAEPEPDLDAIIQTELAPLAQKLNRNM
jgi:multiple sugar transport system substrate-binding protein